MVKERTNLNTLKDIQKELQSHLKIEKQPVPEGKLSILGRKDKQSVEMYEYKTVKKMWKVIKQYTEEATSSEIYETEEKKQAYLKHQQAMADSVEEYLTTFKITPLWEDEELLKGANILGMDKLEYRESVIKELLTIGKKKIIKEINKVEKNILENTNPKSLQEKGLSGEIIEKYKEIILTQVCSAIIYYVFNEELSDLHEMEDYSIEGIINSWIRDLLTHTSYAIKVLCRKYNETKRVNVVVHIIDPITLKKHRIDVNKVYLGVPYSMRSVNVRGLRCDQYIDELKHCSKIKFTRVGTNKIEFEFSKNIKNLEMLTYRTIERVFRNRGNNRSVDYGLFKKNEDPYICLARYALEQMLTDKCKLYIMSGVIPQVWRNPNIIMLAGLAGFNDVIYKSEYLKRMLLKARWGFIDRCGKLEKKILEKIKIEEKNKDTTGVITNEHLKQYEQVLIEYFFKQILNNFFADDIKDLTVIANKEYESVLKEWGKVLIFGTAYITGVKGVFNIEKQEIKAVVTIIDGITYDKTKININTIYEKPNKQIREKFKNEIL